ncbi:hypothetical protein H4R20_002975 [Coemansia guatemalensis]|uniref:RRM domain-containing protein n=1 Tax=Coemansia guatemalensis TaxID=2761395 RepID=A0A9W8HWX2_9FUNG|nr:hypothetical protein H4R20_002975 [Coemansia guatemalensis]
MEIPEQSQEQGSSIQTGASVEPQQQQQQEHHATTGDGAQALLASGLTQEQQESVERARAYAQELQETVFREILEAERKRKEEESRPAAGTLNPGLVGGMDARNHSVMSRVYVGSINFELTEEHIHSVFAEFGSVRSVSMSKDPMTGRHKGFGFVEYDVPEAASLAMEVMNGTMLGGRQLRIGRPNNYNVAVMQGFPPPPPERIYVANVNEAIAEEALREIFAPFGEVRACVLAPDMVARKHRGWGFIEFADESAAEQAAMAMNGFSLGNLVLRVRRCVVGGPLSEGMAALDAEGAAAQATATGAGGSAAPAVRPPAQVMELAASINKSIIGGESAAAEERPAVVRGSSNESGVPKREIQQDVMQKLATSGSAVVQLENVVGGRSEVDDDLAEDMAGEGMKCGRIVKVVVHIASEEELGSGHDRQGGEVCIFVQYAEPESATKALELFDGRWFGGRRVSARLYDPDHYRIVTSTDTMVYIP